MRAVLLSAPLVGMPLLGALAEVPRPLCGDPVVLDQVALQLRQAGRPMELDERSVGEVSTSPGRTIECAARGHVIDYDTTRYGNQPLDEDFVVYYSLELRQNGIFVHVRR